MLCARTNIVNRIVFGAKKLVSLLSFKAATHGVKFKLLVADESHPECPVRMIFCGCIEFGLGICWWCNLAVVAADAAIVGIVVVVMAFIL